MANGNGINAPRGLLHPENRANLLAALGIIEEANKAGQLNLSDMEKAYLPIFREDLESIPDSESHFVEMMLPLLDPGKFILQEYGL